jgi:hypothetical protein
MPLRRGSAWQTGKPVLPASFLLERDNSSPEISIHSVAYDYGVTHDLRKRVPLQVAAAPVCPLMEGLVLERLVRLG